MTTKTAEQNWQSMNSQEVMRLTAEIDALKAENATIRKNLAGLRKMVDDGSANGRAYSAGLEQETEIVRLEAENSKLRDLLDKLPAELRCIAMDYGVSGFIEGVDAANYCADHIDAAHAALGDEK